MKFGAIVFELSGKYKKLRFRFFANFSQDILMALQHNFVIVLIFGN